MARFFIEKRDKSEIPFNKDFSIPKMEFMANFLKTCCNFAFDPNKDITEDFQNIAKIIDEHKEDLLNKLKILNEEFVPVKYFDSVLILCGLEFTLEQL